MCNEIFNEACAQNTKQEGLLKINGRSLKSRVCVTGAKIKQNAPFNAFPSLITLYNQHAPTIYM